MNPSFSATFDNESGSAGSGYSSYSETLVLCLEKRSCKTNCELIKHTFKSLLDKKENVSAVVQTTFGQENYMPFSRRIFYEFPSPTNRSVFSRHPMRNEFFEWQSKAGVGVPKEVYIDEIGSHKIGTRTVLEGSEQHIFTMHWYSMNEPLDKKYFQADTVDIDIAELEKLLEWPKDK